MAVDFVSGSPGNGSSSIDTSSAPVAAPAPSRVSDVATPAAPQSTDAAIVEISTLQASTQAQAASEAPSASSSSESDAVIIELSSKVAPEEESVKVAPEPSENEGAAPAPRSDEGLSQVA